MENIKILTIKYEGKVLYDYHDKNLKDQQNKCIEEIVSEKKD
jgi:D-alanine-D-alanine ligase-like ATP-grasp enzyme